MEITEFELAILHSQAGYSLSGETELHSVELLGEEIPKQPRTMLGQKVTL